MTLKSQIIFFESVNLCSLYYRHTDMIQFNSCYLKKHPCLNKYSFIHYHSLFQSLFLRSGWNIYIESRTFRNINISKIFILEEFCFLSYTWSQQFHVDVTCQISVLASAGTEPPSVGLPPHPQPAALARPRLGNYMTSQRTQLTLQRPLGHCLMARAAAPAAPRPPIARPSPWSRVIPVEAAAPSTALPTMITEFGSTPLQSFQQVMLLPSLSCKQINFNFEVKTSL